MKPIMKEFSYFSPTNCALLHQSNFSVYGLSDINNQTNTRIRGIVFGSSARTHEQGSDDHLFTKDEFSQQIIQNLTNPTEIPAQTVAKFTTLQT